MGGKSLRCLYHNTSFVFRFRMNIRTISTCPLFGSSLLKDVNGRNTFVCCAHSSRFWWPCRCDSSGGDQKEQRRYRVNVHPENKRNGTLSAHMYNICSSLSYSFIVWKSAWTVAIRSDRKAHARWDANIGIPLSSVVKSGKLCATSHSAGQKFTSTPRRTDDWQTFQAVFKLSRQPNPHCETNYIFVHRSCSLHFEYIAQTIILSHFSCFLSAIGCDRIYDANWVRHALCRFSSTKECQEYVRFFITECRV